MQKALHEVTSQAELNCLLARTNEELSLFNELDAQPIWPSVPTGRHLILTPSLFAPISNFLHSRALLHNYARKMNS